MSSGGVIRLTEFCSADIPALVEGDRDTELRRRFGFPHGFEPCAEHSQRVIERWQDERRQGTRFAFAVRPFDGDTLLGGCELQPRSASIANVSYWTYAAHRNRGIASRAVGLVCRAAFSDFGFTGVEILIDVDHDASRRVALHNGFRLAGLRDGQSLFELRGGG